LVALAAELRQALGAGEDLSPAPPAPALHEGKYTIHIHGGQVGAIGDGTYIEGGINFGGLPPAAPIDAQAALLRARRALAALEEQAAGYTTLTIPVHLKLDLEDKRREVAELTRRIHEPHSTRLDVAVPRKVCLGRVFDVAVATRLSSSPLLEVEGLSQVRSGDTQILWIEGEVLAHLRLKFVAPECQIVGADHHTFFLAKGQESVIFYFHLIPQQIGDITVIVTLYQEHDTLGNARVRTTVIESVTGAVQLKVASQPVRITNFNFTVQKGGKLQAGVIGSDAKIEDGVNFESED
jgi:hypothetical protein